MNKLIRKYLLLAAVLLPLATTAQTYQPVPYTEGFENPDASNALPTGWVKYLTGTSGVSAVFPCCYQHSPNARTGSYYFELESNAGATELCATPEFANPSNLMLDLYIYFLNDYSHTLLEIGVMEDSTFVPVDTITGSTYTGSYHSCRVYLVDYSGPGHRIGFRATYTGTGTYTVFIDDMTISNAPSCAYMPGTVSSTVDSSSATLTWGEATVSAGYYIYLNNDSTWYYSSGNSYSFSDLTANTLYTGFVYNNCTGSDTSEAVPFSFRTSCGMPQFPLVETMEGYEGSFPSCWNITEQYSSYPNLSSGQGLNGGTAISLGSNSNTVSFASPYLYGPINTFETKFWARKASDYYGVDMAVGYVTDLSHVENAVMLDTISLTSTWTEYTVSFGGLTTTDSGYIIYRKFVPNYNYSGVYLDDITIRTVRSCRIPEDLHTTGTSTGTMNLAWTDTLASAWEVAYGPAGMDPDTAYEGIATFSSPYGTITGLEDTITYDFYVRADCGGEQSYWLGPVTARPNLHVMTANHTDTVQMCGGTITDNGGLTGNYANSQNSYLIIYPTDNTQGVTLSGYVELYYSSYYISHLRVYEGVGTNGRQLCDITGNDSLNVASTEGPLTINFQTGSYYNSNGFALNVGCYDLPTCTDPYDIVVSDVAGGSAQVSWSYGTVTTPESFTIAVTDTAAGTTTTYTVTDEVRSYLISGLNQRTTYYVSVTANCSSADVSNMVGTYFTTICFVGGNTQIGEGTSTATSHPINTYYNYSYCQMLFRASDFIQSMDTVYGIKLLASSVSSGNFDIDIYIDSTSVNNLTSSTAIPMDSTKRVYSATRSFQSGENEFTFDTPWVRPSSNCNIVITIDNNTGSYSGSSNWYYTSGNNGTTLYQYNDGTNVDPASPSTSLSTTGNRPNVVFMAPCGDASCVAPNVSVGSTAANSITLVWVPGMSETSWRVEYKPASDTTWTVAYASTTNQTETITGLAANTLYNFRVGSICPVGSEMPYNYINARTACATMFRSTLPMDEGFEGYNTGDMPNCWIRTATGTSGSGTFPSCYNYSSNARNGNVYFELEAENGGTEIFALPAFDTINGLALDFYVATTSSYAPTALELGVLVGDTAFDVLDTIDLSNCTSLYSYLKKSVLIDYNGLGDRIAFRATKTSRYTVFMDDFTLYVPNPCDSVRNISVDSVGTHNVTISWVDANNTGSYTLFIATSDNEAAAFDSVTTTATSHTFTGLNSATDYYIYIHANCPNGRSDMNMVHVTTSCEIIATFPWSEDFENFTASSSSGSPTQQCWNRGSTYTYASYPYLYSYYNHTEGGSNSIYMYPYYHCWLALPEMDNLDSLILKFYMMGPTPSSYTYQAEVGVLSDQNDQNTFVAIDTVTYTGTGSNDWQRMRVDLSAAPDSCHFICIRTIGSSYSSFYIDDLSLNYNNGCAELSNLLTSAVGMSTATIGWTDTSNNGSYIVAVSATNNLADAFLTDTVTTTNYSFTGLAAVTSYYVWVLNNCPNGTSDLLSGNFTTLAADPHFLPYFNDFEDTTNTFTLYQLIGSNGWHIGSTVNHGGSNSLYVTNDGGTTNAYTNTNQSISFALTYLQIPYDSTYAISYDWRCQGEGSYDLMRVALVPEDFDFSTAFTAVNRYSNTLPTGWIALDGGKRNLRNTWQYDQNGVRLNAGNYYLTVVWINDGAMGSNPPAAIDNISMSLITCPAPEGLTASSASASTIDVDWTAGTASSWMVEYGVNGFAAGTGTRRTVSTNHITLSGLAPTTSYDIYVRPICSATDTGFASMVTCLTGCDSVINIFPWVEDFENGIACWSQNYQTGDVGWTVGRGGNAYGGMSGAATGQYNARFSVNSYLGYTTTLVSPMLNIPTSDEVMMTFYHAQPAWGTDQDTLAVVYRVHPDSAWHYLASWNTSITSWQPDTVMLPNATATYQVGFKAHSGFGLGILLDSVVVYGTESCTRPVFTNSNVEATSVSVTWNSPASSFDVAIRAAGQAWPEPTRINAHTHTFTRLEPNTHYEYRVRSICSDTALSFWSTANCLTDTLVCYKVEGLNVVEADYQSVTLNWDADPSGHAVGYVVSISNTAFSSSDTVYSNTVTLGNLEPGITYGVTVQSLCSATTYSDWCETLNFTTPICTPVTNVVASQITSHSAVVDWTPGEGETTWQINYGYRGFQQGNGNLITVTSHPYTITGLEDETDYDVYVRAVCTDEVSSLWSIPATFTTPIAVGIEDIAEGIAYSIYPNPTSDATTITVSGANGQVVIEVVDMNGRTVSNQTLECPGNCTQEMNVEGLAQGAYFVRITTDEVSVVRKLVVR